MITKRMKYVLIALFIFVLSAAVVRAAITASIDPNNTGAHFAAFVRAPGQAGSESINFGKYTTASSANITISGGSLHGYAWNPLAGWIVMNCANTTSGCSSANQNFKISVSDAGVFSGYAWGQQTGWINFGPFLNNTTPQIKIAADGTFGGTTGTAGYAWSQKYGWIVFDCTNTATCTTIGTTVTPSTGNQTGISGGGSASGSAYVTPPTATPIVESTIVPGNTEQPPIETAPTPISPVTTGSTTSGHSGSVSGGFAPQPTGLPTGISPTTAPDSSTVPSTVPVAKKKIIPQVVSGFTYGVQFVTSLVINIVRFIKSIFF
ncbi:MAG: hypothetical protein JWL92_137 [Candidatus Nomurabacteria bacterium]|nr:hypothetical protein [Candidatus Nomurabacteria bacterium]